jgi:triosephosphate isomerase (TIM)
LEKRGTLRHHPVIVINFKAYPDTIGKKAVHLAKICEKVAITHGVDIRVAVAATDICEVAKQVTIPVYSEHVDEYPLGKHTGSILPEMIKTVGAKGTILNHSEHKIPMKKLEECIKRAKGVGLVTIVCADGPKEEREILEFSSAPDFIAIEPPQLIGGEISVSTAKPELITRSVEEVRNKKGVRLLVGAGIKTLDDIETALRLGADGVLIASGIDLAKDPEQALEDMIPTV